MFKHFKISDNAEAYVDLPEIKAVLTMGDRVAVCFSDGLGTDVFKGSYTESQNFAAELVKEIEDAKSAKLDEIIRKNNAEAEEISRKLIFENSVDTPHGKSTVLDEHGKIATEWNRSVYPDEIKVLYLGDLKDVWAILIDGEPIIIKYFGGDEQKARIHIVELAEVCKLKRIVDICFADPIFIDKVYMDIFNNNYKIALQVGDHIFTATTYSDVEQAASAIKAIKKFCNRP